MKGKEKQNVINPGNISLAEFTGLIILILLLVEHRSVRIKHEKLIEEDVLHDNRDLTQFLNRNEGFSLIFNGLIVDWLLNKKSKLLKYKKDWKLMVWMIL